MRHLRRVFDQELWMVLALLVANLFHGLVALLWSTGLRRMAGPLAPALWADILSICLVMPVVVTLGWGLGLPPVDEKWSLVRVGFWAESLRGQGVAIWAVLLLLLAGTLAIFLYQELIPAWRSRRGRLHTPRRPDSRLDASLTRVIEGYRASCPRCRTKRSPQILCLQTDQTIAALYGLTSPIILISEGLLRRLDQDELDAVVAHEVAHILRGDNLGLLTIWLIRALQAMSPGALVLFRNLAEAQEAACDDLAARATGRPAALASALLKVYRSGARRPPTGAETAFKRARVEVSRHSERVSIELRVRSLLDNAPSGVTSRALLALTTLVLGVMLWAVG